MASDELGNGGRPPAGDANIEDPYQAAPPPAEAYPTHDEQSEGSSHSMKPTYLGIGAVVVVLVIILAAVVIGQGSDDNTPGAGSDLVATGSSKTDGANSSEGTGDSGSSGPAKSDRGWPDSVSGRPAAFGERGTPPPSDGGSLTPGAYLWIDFDGWHLWIVRGPGVEGITGRIELEAEPTRAAPAVDGQGQVVIDGNAIEFDLTDVDAPVVGVEFNTFYAGSMEVALEGSDGPIDAANVRTGRKETPASNPIVIAKEG